MGEVSGWRVNRIREYYNSVRESLVSMCMKILGTRWSGGQGSREHGLGGARVTPYCMVYSELMPSNGVVAWLHAEALRGVRPRDRC